MLRDVYPKREVSRGFVGRRPRIWHQCSNCGTCYVTKHCEVCKEPYYRNELIKYSRINAMSLPEYSVAKGGKVIPTWEVHMDHIVPVWYGMMYEIPVFEMASAENLHFVCAVDNMIDPTVEHAKGSLLPDDWFAMITGKDWLYTLPDGRKSHSLEFICRNNGLSYVKAASQLIKQMATEIKVGGVTIYRS